MTAQTFNEQPMTYRLATDVVGSYVVFDPTGRDLADCMEVGRVTRVVWTADDDGDDAGRPRPILYVLPNSAPGDREDYMVVVTRIHSVVSA